MPWEPNYIEVDDLADYMRIDHDADDAELAAAIAAACSAINTYCRRQFGSTDDPESRTYAARWDSWRCLWVVDVDDFQGAVTVTYDGDPVTDVTPWPLNAVAKGGAYTRLHITSSSVLSGVHVRSRGDVEVDVTTVWGWADYPDPVPLAARLQASRFHSRRDSPYGVAGSPDMGNELRLLARVDPDVAVMLKRVQRKVGPR